VTGPERGAMLPDPQERFLNEVMRPVSVPGPVESCTKENRLKTLKEEPEGLPISTCKLLDKPLIGNTVFHRQLYSQDGEDMPIKITGSTNTRNGAFDSIFG